MLWREGWQRLLAPGPEVSRRRLGRSATRRCATSAWLSLSLQIRAASHFGCLHPGQAGE